MKLFENDVNGTERTEFLSLNQDEAEIKSQTIIKMIVVITFILANIENLMLLGVIHFEKYGQDPMKRSFPDRMFANFCWLHVYVSFVNSIIEEYRTLIGKYCILMQVNFC